MEKRKIFDLLMTKIVWFILSILFYILITKLLEYKFNNMILNAVILYMFSSILFLAFSFGSFDIFYDYETNNIKFNKQEYKEKQLLLKLHYPKIYLYSQVIFFIDFIVKLIAWFMFIYGCGKYLLT